MADALEDMIRVTALSSQRVSTNDDGDQQQNIQNSLCLLLQEPFPSILQIPVTPLGEHAAEREIDLRVPVRLSATTGRIR